MSKFEIEGYAKRKVKCDLAIVKISFRAIGTQAYELSRKVMEDCDDFTVSLSEIGIKPKDIQLVADCVDTRSYNNNTELEAKRTIRIWLPFEVKILNRIQGALQHGKYNYVIDIYGDVADSHQVLSELSEEALNNSKNIAYRLAANADMRVKGIESIRKDRWDDEEDIGRRPGDWGCNDICGIDEDDLYGGTRPSDEIEAKYIEKEVRLKVTWDIA